MSAPVINGWTPPERIWLHDLGCGDVTWCEDPDPDGEQIEAVEYIRADTRPPTDVSTDGLVAEWTDKLKELYAWTGSEFVGDHPDLYGFMCSLIGHLIAGEALERRNAELEGALRQCRTNICGYNIQNFKDAAKTVAAFHKEIIRIDAVARKALSHSSETGK